MGNRKQTKEHLLKTALELFAQRGYHGVTTRDVARRARRNEALLFRYFGDKRGLLQAVIDGYRLPLSDPPFDDPDRYEVEEFFHLLSEDWYRVYAAQPDFFRLMRYCSLEAPQILKGYTKFYRESRVLPILEYISRKQAEGVLRKDVSPIAILLGFGGPLNAWLEIRLWTGDQNGDVWKTFRDEWLRMFLDAVRTKKAGRTSGAPALS